MITNELRVGNYVDYFSEGVDRWLNGYKLSKDDLICLLSGPTDHADAINLSAHWLEILGFKRSDTIKKSSSFFFIPVGGSELHINPDNGVVWIERGDNIFNCPTLVLYVHQLQNLYFALTNKELDVTN